MLKVKLEINHSSNHGHQLKKKMAMIVVDVVKSKMSGQFALSLEIVDMLHYNFVLIRLRCCVLQGC